ncbi:MAG: putative S-layer protein/N-acetylmuramoyl-L-alanine amidase [Clostridiales bacterium]|jgi:hypothetical protein|nr:putative S-layer protein/N-acetylmuramoyl-L-alanine amidase [Clostridiales bacterium]
MKKNFRKVLALVLAVAMSVSTFTVAFAAEKTDGEALKVLGLIKGNESGDLMESSTITRAEASQIVSVVMGWDLEAASSYTFSDDTWAKAQAATLVKNKITNGIGNNKFGGTQKMDQLQVYAWIYAALTGDTASAWANPQLLSAILPADKVAEVIEAKGTNAKRSEVFGGMVTILTTEGTDGTTQLDKLIEAGKVTEEAALASGLVEEVVVTENVVVSAELLNYKEVKFVFTNEASDDAAKYTINGVAATAVKVSEDKKEAIVEIATKVAPQAKATVAFVNGEYKFEKTDLTIIDATLPTVANIQTTNKGELTVTFSEAIETLPAVKVDNGMLYASVAKLNSRQVKVTINSAVDGQSYKLEVSGAVDFAGYTMAPKTFESYKYEAVKTPVTVSVKEANTSEVVLELSAATVKLQADVLAANFTHILNKAVNAATVSADGKLITLDLSNYAAPEGTWTLKVANADTMFVDSWGNKAAKDITLTFTVTIDKVVPTVEIKSLDQANNKLVVKFSETVLNATNYANYDIQDKDGKSVTGALATGTAITVVDNEYTLSIDKTKFVSEGYTLVVNKAITDKAGNALAEGVKLPFAAKYMNTLIASVKAIQTTAGKTNKLYITFSNNMPSSTVDASKWVLSVGGVSQEITSIVFDEGSTKTIVVTTKAEFTNANVSLETTAFTDVDGNKLAGATLSAVVVNNAAVTFETSVPTIIAKATATQTVQVTVNGKVTTGISTDAFKFTVATETATAAVITNVDVKEEGGVVTTVFTVAVPEQMKFDSNGENTKGAVTLEVAGLKLNNGVALDTASSIAIADGIASTVTAITATAATHSATLAVNEALVSDATKNALFATELVVTLDGKVLVAGNEYTVLVSGSAITVSLVDTTTDITGKDLTVKLASSSKYIKDANQNALNAFELTAKAQ